MNKTTKTINKSNWSGESITYTKIGNKIKLFGYTFEMVHKVDKDFDTEWYNILCDGQEAFTIYKISDTEWSADECGVSREGEDPADVLVEMVCNLY